MTMHYSANNEAWNAFDHEDRPKYALEVTHWMYLPEPPKEQENKQQEEMKMNAREVLTNVNAMIAEGEFSRQKWRISDVCNDLGIFDWWNDYLSVSQLKQMRRFLEVAISHGFIGYVCFKVGAKGCSNGMWAYKVESTTGYSPDGEAIYHSFINGRNYYGYCNPEGVWLRKEDKVEFTLKEIEQAMTA